jgi:NADPH:quinone reductase-like Zn-dependent oxidoreductase
MKAIVCEKYGMPENLKPKEVEKPIPKDNEVLIKICATAVNDYDWSMVRGKPYLYRLMFGITKPKNPIPGMELSGMVEGVGANVKRLKVGDSVYGDISFHGFGTYAAYIAIDEKAVIKKPVEMGFLEAASLPHASLLALQALRDIGKIGKGQKVLINGAGGGVGTFGLQLAKHYECQVTGVDTGEKLEMMKTLGFDHVMDYKMVDFTRTGQKFDLILDCKSTRSPFAYLRSLKPNGTYVTVGGLLFRLLQIFILTFPIPFFSKKQLKILSLKPNQGLTDIGALYLQNKIKCVIDGPYSLEEAPRLLRYFGEGRHQGKVVIKIN